MKRRDLLKVGGGSALALGATAAHAAEGGETFHWKIVMTWPKGYPGLGTGVQWFADEVKKASNGRLDITVYGAGELVPAFEVFNVVSDGTAQMGHGPSYYWKGKVPAAEIFCAMPFGMTPLELDAWYQKEGLALLNECYQPFGVIARACGNSDFQMGAWFNKEIKSVADLKGLKIRIPGIAGEVYRLSGASPVTMPGGDIFTSLQSGVIDAADWVGPWSDRAFGLNKVAKYYYNTWNEPGSACDLMINAKAYASLPADLQAIVDNVSRATGSHILSEFRANNALALSALEKSGTELRYFPDDVIAEFKKNTAVYLEKYAAQSPLCAKILKSYQDFLVQQRGWSNNELRYLKMRNS